MARGANFVGKPGPGRPKGSVNKTTVSVKEALLKVYEKRGGDEAFLQWSRENPDEFYKLWGRLLPHEVTNADGEAFRIALEVAFVSARRQD